MNLECAKASGLEHLIDTRFAGEARGVGTGKILGRVHIAHLRVGNCDFDCRYVALVAL
jgi:DNA damage-inducible protein 1